MFKIGETRQFTFGRFIVETEHTANFNFIDLPVNPTSKIYKIIKIYVLKGRKILFIGISDKGHILMLPDNVALENIK